MEQRLFFTLLVSLFANVISLQAQEVRAGSLRIEYDSKTPVQVEIKGPMYFRESINNSIIFSGLIPGEYTLKVFSYSRNERNNLLTNERVVISPQQRTLVYIEKNGRVSVRSVADNNDVFLSSRHYGRGSYPDRRYDIDTQGPLNEREFDQLIATLKKAPFDKDKLEILSVSAGYSTFYTEQIRVIMKQFAFDDGKFACAKMLVPRSLDSQNLYVLANDFSFTSTRNKFYEYLKSRSF